MFTSTVIEWTEYAIKEKVFDTIHVRNKIMQEKTVIQIERIWSQKDGTLYLLTTEDMNNPLQNPSEPGEDSSISL